MWLLLSARNVTRNSHDPGSHQAANGIHSAELPGTVISLRGEPRHYPLKLVYGPCSCGSRSDSNWNCNSQYWRVSENNEQCEQCEQCRQKMMCFFSRMEISGDSGHSSFEALNTQDLATNIGAVALGKGFGNVAP